MSDVINISKIKQTQVPSSIKLGYRTIDLVAKDMPDDFGEFVHGENKIFYSNKVTPPELTNTILHELLHAIWQDRVAELVSDKKEETIVNALANALMTLLCDNPDMLKFLTNGMINETKNIKSDNR